jgi:transcriptional regulator with XRE-family HTH domain
MTPFIDRMLRAAKHAGVGESQSEIADSLGLARQTVNRWFKGGEPNAEQTFSIARTWRVSPEWLKSGTGEMLPSPGDGLSLEEKDLIRNYRSATPQVRQVISTMARAVRKSVVTIALAIPPLLAPKPADAAILHNQNSSAVGGLNTHWMRRVIRWLSTFVNVCAPCHAFQ